jgi:hypothetical protein
VLVIETPYFFFAHKNFFACIFLPQIIVLSYYMGGFWPLMNADGRLDTCELNEGYFFNKHCERVRKGYNSGPEIDIKYRIIHVQKVASELN